MEPVDELNTARHSSIPSPLSHPKMPRHLSSITAPPPPPVTAAAHHHNSSSTPASVIILIVLFSTIAVAAAIYFLYRFFLRRNSAVADEVIAPTSSSAPVNTSKDVIALLPTFTFGAVTGNLTGGDCAVCLSEFERNDLLRLFPLCCHAFHAQCVDTWLADNQTCPLCRSAINPSEDEILSKILSQTTDGSFRIEIGSVSRHRTTTDETNHRRLYSVGDFEYIVDDHCEVPIDSMQFAPSAPEMPAEDLAAGDLSRSWLRDYIDRLGSSFRSSARFGSSRRSEVAVVADMEMYRVGEEIGDFFRWLSGV